MEIDSIERNGIHRCYVRFEEKSIDNELKRLFKKLLDNTSDIQELDLDELYLIIDGDCHLWFDVPELSDKFNLQHYFEWQRRIDKVISDTQTAFKEYRATIREKLHL